jgi:hypothetical protein
VAKNDEMKTLNINPQFEEAPKWQKWVLILIAIGVIYVIVKTVIDLQ